MSLKVGTLYFFNDYPDGPGTEPELSQVFIDPNTGIKETFNDLVDAQCDAIVAAGNTAFKLLTSQPNIFNGTCAPDEDGGYNFPVEVHNGTGTNGLKAAYLQNGKLINYYENDTQNLADGNTTVDIPNPEGVSGAYQVCLILVVGGISYYSPYFSVTF